MDELDKGIAELLVDRFGKLPDEDVRKAADAMNAHIRDYIREGEWISAEVDRLLAEMLAEADKKEITDERC